MAKGMGSSYQLLRHWQSRVSGKQVDVNTCQLDDGGVSSREGERRQWHSPALVK